MYKSIFEMLYCAYFKCFCGNPYFLWLPLREINSFTHWILTINFISSRVNLSFACYEHFTNQSYLCTRAVSTWMNYINTLVFFIKCFLNFFLLAYHITRMWHTLYTDYYQHFFHYNLQLWLQFIQFRKDGLRCEGVWRGLFQSVCLPL